MATGLIGVTPLTVLLFAWGFRCLPSGIYDLALETCLSPLATWYRVAMPLVRPITAAAAGLAFLASWGSSIEPLVLLSDDRWFTVQVVVGSLSALDPPFRPLMLAGAVVAVAPALAAFAVVVRGVSRSTMIGRPVERSAA
jgi:multiple sugar transport system permease protein